MHTRMMTNQKSTAIVRSIRPTLFDISALLRPISPSQRTEKFLRPVQTSFGISAHWLENRGGGALSGTRQRGLPWKYTQRESYVAGSLDEFEEGRGLLAPVTV